MRALLRAAALAAALACAGGAQAQKSFVREDLASDGVRLEQSLRTEAGAERRRRPRRPAQARRGRPGRARRSAPRARPFAAALAADPRDAQSWLGFALARRARSTPADDDERYRLRERAPAAAYLAYQRAATRAEEAAALALLGEISARQEQWRPALERLPRQPRSSPTTPAVRQTYEALARRARLPHPRLQGRFGFRLAPRLLPVLGGAGRAARPTSRPSSPSSGAANAAVTAEGQQLCVDGLRTASATPSSSARACPRRSARPCSSRPITRSTSATARPRCASPAATTSCPAPGQEGIPVVSVNTDKVDVEVFRIGDRSLLPTMRSEDFLSQLSPLLRRGDRQREGRQGLDRHARHRARSSTATWSPPSRCSRRSARSSPAST